MARLGQRVLLVCAVVCAVRGGTVTTDDAVDEVDCPGKGACGGGGVAENELQTTGEPQVLITQTQRPVPKPKSLSMVAEDHMEDHVSYVPTPLPSNSSVNSPTKQNSTSINQPSNKTSEVSGKARALNFTIDKDSGKMNVLSRSGGNDDSDLSDVTIDDDDDHELVSKILAPKMSSGQNITKGYCEKGGLTYENGVKLEHGCDEVCTCINGKMDCVDRCKGPMFRKGKKIEDPLCSAKDSDDPCCSVLVCAGDTETEPLEMCTFNNKTYNRGDTFKKDCSEVCTCEIAGKISCKPRCLPQKKTSDRCVEVPDPNDSCCKKVLCDVTLDDHNSDKDDEKTMPKILSAKYINATAIQIEFEPKLDDSERSPIIEVSNDKSRWSYYQMLPGGLLFVRERSKYLKLDTSDDVVTIQNVDLVPIEEGSQSLTSDGCIYKGKSLKFKEEYNDDCNALCICKEDGVQCLKLECPTYFGVDVLDPNCVEWETIPPNFKASPPHCCPDEIRCKNNGSCLYEGKTYQNWEQIPMNITGCDQRCYCENGKVDCQNVCPPVTALPPPKLCPQGQPKVGLLPGEDCCKSWICDKESTTTGFGGFGNNNFPNFGQPQDDVKVDILESIDAHTIKLEFRVPPVIVGLHGRVEVRYTHGTDDDLNAWESQVFAPPNDLIETPSLEFDLHGLRPDTEYKIKITITLRDLHNTHSSKIYTIRTKKEVEVTTLPPKIPIEPELSISDINATWVIVNWRKFKEYELQFIDGVQLRYKEIDTKIYTATPLIHRAVTSFTLENLKPNSKYELGIFFIPFPNQRTELHAENMLHFTTANEIDTYGFSVNLDIIQIKSTSVEISWSGVPYPEDKYVNIYRAIYQSDSGKEDHSTFKMAKRDSPTKTIIMDLKPGTRYRLWLEIYLTNGKIKTSNVQDFITKPRLAPALGASSHQDKLARESVEAKPQGDYYGPLVVVAILAAIAILSTLVLLLVLVRRRGQHKAAITPPPTAAARVSQAAYDNPTYKVEIQQETMGL